MLKTISSFLTISREKFSATRDWPIAERIRYLPLLICQQIKYESKANSLRRIARRELREVRLLTFPMHTKDCCDVHESNFAPGLRLDSISELEGKLKRVAVDTTGEYFVCRNCGQIWKNAFSAAGIPTTVSDHVYKYDFE